MVLTTTAVAFSFSSIGLAICGFWFYRAFQKIGGQRAGKTIGILLSALFLSISLQHSILALGGLFFATNPEALYAVLAIDIFVLAAVAALGVYLAFYILLPKFSPWPATVITFLFGVLVSGLIVAFHPRPFINVKDSIDWNMPHWLDALTYLLLLLNIGPIFIIFTKNFFHAVAENTKIISAIISLLALAGIINVSILFTPLLTTTPKTHFFDFIMGTIGILFIVIFLVIFAVTSLVSHNENTRDQKE